jgi:hypothetical protein
MAASFYSGLPPNILLNPLKGIMSQLINIESVSLTISDFNKNGGLVRSK